MSKSLGDRLLTIVNLCGLVGIALLLGRPTGIVGTRVSSWKQARRDERALKRYWDTMSRTGSELGIAPTGGTLLVEFSDYQCPICRLQYQSLSTALAAVPAASVRYIQFPLPFHPQARAAARAAICAEDQGSFQAMHKRLFTTDAWFSNPDWRAEADAAGVPDIKRFVSCLRDPSTDARVTDQIAIGDRLGISGTPTFFNSTKRLLGYADSAMIDKLVSRAR